MLVAIGQIIAMALLPIWMPSYEHTSNQSEINQLFSILYVLWQDSPCLGEKTCQHFTMNKEQKFTQDEENTAAALAP